MAPKKVLVTGGTGFIGSALTKALIHAGHQVRTLDNSSRGSEKRLDSVAGEFEHVQGDIRDFGAVIRALKGMDSVLHLAYVNGTEHFYSMPEVVLDVGVKGIINVIDGCKEAGVGELILASSSEVYQTPSKVPTDENVALVIPDVFNPRYSYGAGKIISEVMAINCGRKFFERVMIFRPHNIYGPDMGWEHVIPQFVLRMKKLAQETEVGKRIQFPLQGSGEETRAFCFIDDAVNAVMKVVDHGQHLEIYNIGTDDEVTIKQVATQVAAYFGREIELVQGELALGGTLRRCPDVSKITALGYEPKVTLEAGINVTAAWYEANAERATAKI